MASLSKDNTTIQFTGKDGKRHTIRLAKVLGKGGGPKGKGKLVTARVARDIKEKIEALNIAAITGQTWEPELARWVAGISDPLHAKLAKVGLVPPRKPAEPEPEVEIPTLGPFLAEYIRGRLDLKAGTITGLEQVRSDLVSYFGADKPLADVTEGDADNFRIKLRQRLSENTTRRRCGRARQFFAAAVKHRLITSNPFGQMKGLTVGGNRDRDYFVSRDEAQAVLDACPDSQWKLLFALSRYGGLRCPSEHLALCWGDIDWERGRMRVRSPKTEHHEGHEERIMPIFSELRPYLDAVWDEAPAGEHVITRYRDAAVNLRTQLLRIIRKAGLKPWPKLWQNLRATRATELADRFPSHVCADWLGHSEVIADRHYRQTTEEHFTKALHEVTLQPAATTATNGSEGKRMNEKPLDVQKTLKNKGEKLAREGFEPPTKGL